MMLQRWWFKMFIFSLREQPGERELLRLNVKLDTKWHADQIRDEGGEG